MDIFEFPVFTHDPGHIKEIVGMKEWRAAHIYEEFEYARISLNADLECLVYITAPDAREIRTHFKSSVLPKAPFCLYWFHKLSEKDDGFIENYRQLFETPLILTYPVDESEPPSDESLKIIRYDLQNSNVFNDILKQAVKIYK